MINYTKKITGFVLLIFFINSIAYATIDRAVQIARKAKNNVEYRGKHLKAISDKVFREFALKTSELQKLLDTRKHLDQAGLLDSNDHMGKLRKRNLNAKIIANIGELKEICDNNIDALLSALDTFDRTVVQSIVDSQATRSINTNYELNLKEYIKRSSVRFDNAMQEAEKLLYDCNNGKDKRSCEKYNRSKLRLQRINETKKLYQTRMIVTTNNQKVSEAIRDQIKSKGFRISSKLRQLLTKLYITYSKVSPITVSDFGDSSSKFDSINFNELDAFSNQLEVVDSSITKLNGVMDSMVNEVIGGLGNISEVNGKFVNAAQISTEEELIFLQKLKKEWKQ